ncbi:hypothetical protein [Phytohabitans suffuscus]|uniref:hypothetical protein n=1 Tax=Phytohabitans suffuscus TaxID=624315 RepID=UPI0015671FE2|nr:hypothetical protein [Phytohabitans suffuscus]
MNAVHPFASATRRNASARSPDSSSGCGPRAPTSAGSGPRRLELLLVLGVEEFTPRG